MFATQTKQGLVELPALGSVSLHAVHAALQAHVDEQVWVLIELLASPDAMRIIDQLPTPVFKEVLRDWEHDSEVKVGEVLSIGKLVKLHGEALEADLIAKGLRLRYFPSEDFSWRDLKIVIKHLSVHSSLYAAIHPDRAGWDMQNLLLANIADSLVWLQWAQTKDGKKGLNRPKPIPRPGVAEPPREGAKPKPSTLSAIKAKFAERYAPPSRIQKSQKLNDLFGRS